MSRKSNKRVTLIKPTEHTATKLNGGSGGMFNVVAVVFVSLIRVTLLVDFHDTQFVYPRRCSVHLINFLY